MKKKLLFALLALLTTSAIRAADGDTFQANTVEGVEMTFKVISEKKKTCQVGNGDSNSCSINNSTVGTVTIPATVNDYNVTIIGNYAFNSCSGLTSITIPNSVTTIGNYAFNSCSGLTNITIPNSVTTIGDRAFQSCSGLTNITIPNSVTTIKYGAFKDCSSLTSVTISNSVTTIGSSAFQSCSGLTSITIPNSVTTIGSSAFQSCSGLTSITIPNSVTTIGDYAFQYCSGLTSINIPNSVTTIGRSAFQRCSGLTSITIPNSVTTIGDYAFDGCSGLTSINIPYSVTTIGDRAFQSCSGLTSINIPSSVTTIGNSVVDYCGNLSLVKVGWDSPINISPYAFPNREVMTLSVPLGTKEAYSAADYWKEFDIVEGNVYQVTIDGICYNLMEKGMLATVVANATTEYSGDITIPASVTYEGNTYQVNAIGNYAFYYCYNLKSINIPNSVTTIGSEAFYYCGLTSITIPNSVTNIGNGAFHCGNLSSVKVEWDSPANISSDVFPYREEMTLNIPLGTKDAYTAADYWNEFNIVEGYVYQGVTIDDICYNLAEKGMLAAVVANATTEYSGDITIPASVTYEGNAYQVYAIDNSAFYYCRDLTSITIPNSVTTIGCSAFEYCYALTSITIPNSVTTIGDDAFYGCSALTSITIPNSVTTIGDKAFGDCGKLSVVKVGWDSPVNISSDVFPSREGVTLTIPSGTKEAYTAADYWKEFNIVEGNVYQGVTIDGICYNLAEHGMLATVVANAAEKYSGDITIPASVTYEGNTYQVTAIGNSAFYYCKDLTSIAIPGSVTTIGNSAFYGCSSLTSITIPNSVTTIGSSAFYYCSGLTSITIPNSVTTIGSSTFESCSGLTSITIPNSVTTIGDDAFSYCSRLSLVKVGWDSPVNISSDVFPNREGVTLTIPSGTKEAYTTADYWKEFNIVEGNVYQGVTIDGIFYNLAEDGMLATVIANAAEKYSGDITIPASVTYEGNTYQVNAIGNASFSACWYLTSITIPNSVTTIGNSAFSNCSSLTNITIPNNVTTIGNSAFSNCSSLTNITIPNNVTTIGNSAFYGCSGLTSITIPNNITTIGNYAFQACSKLSLVKVGWDSPVNISSNVFSSRNNATLNIPLGTKDAYTAANYWKEFNIVEGNVYQGVTIDGICYNLAEDGMLATVIANATAEYSGDITIPASVTYEGNTYQVCAIYNSAFRSCSGLTSITIPNSVTTIGDYAFWSCSALTSIAIPGSVTTIGNSAFRSCSGLTSITIPNSVTTISSNAFYDCSKLSLVKVGWYSPVNISSGVFSKCEGVTLSVPSGTKEAYTATDYWKEFSIVEGNVYQATIDGICYNLAEDDMLATVIAKAAAKYSGDITIPASVTYEGNTYQVKAIGNNAFYFCLDLTSITFPNSVTTIGNSAFCDCWYLTSITIPNSVTTIGDYAFYGCSSLTSITIPNSVTTIGSYAFFVGSGMTSIISESKTPPTLGDEALGNSEQKSNITLYIPLQTTKTYQDAGWTGFKEYIEMTEGTSRSLTISSAGQGTYCTDIDLDFSGIEDVKAYIASGFIQKTGTVILTRVTDVPAGTGLFVKGAAGTYEIPYKASSAYYKNMLKGNIDPVSVDPTTGDYANFYLSNGSDGLGFYRISSMRTMSANRAILCVPQSLFETVAEARRVNIVFDDETTGIDSVTHQTNDEKVYNLKGQRVSQPQRGLYIVDGKKVYVK